MNRDTEIDCPSCKAPRGVRCYHPAHGWTPTCKKRLEATSGLLILMSGGMDSSLLLRRASKAFTKRKIVPLFVEYGQPHAEEERRAARAIAEGFGLHLAVQEMLLAGVMQPGHTPVVPGRNLALIAIAANRAVIEGCSEIQIGCCAADADTFRDCRLPFLQAAGSACEAYGVSLTAPLLRSTKREIRDELGRMFPQTWSCYHPRKGEPCGECGACKARNAVT